MQPELFTPGKDASLADTIKSMQTSLADLGFDIEEYACLNPVENIWSVQVRNRACQLMSADGSGTSREAALASALGEYFKRLAGNDFWNDYYLGDDIAHAPFAHSPQEQWFPITDTAWPEALLTAELHALYNPTASIPAEALIDLNTGNYERGICALPYIRQQDNVDVLFPVNIISNLYLGNGMAAGNTPTAARVQALSEIFACHVKLKVLRDGLCLPDIPEEVIARHPVIAASIDALRAAGFGLLVKDASLGGRYPVMCASLLNPEDQGVCVSFGAHPKVEIALERALTGLLQGRSLEALAGFPPPGLDLDEVAGSPNIGTHFIDASGIVHWNFLSENADFSFTDWNFSHGERSTADDCQWLLERLHDDGYDIYIADFNHLGVHACRILVPGFSEIYPIDDLAWHNNSHGAALRPPILHLNQLEEEECAQLFDMLNEMNLANERPVAALIGLAPDPGSLWADLHIGELKTLLALATGDTEAILEGCAWIRQFGQEAAERRRVYRCIETLLELDDPNIYEEALISLYGEETLDLASDLIDGEVRFFDLKSPGLHLSDCHSHQQLLAEYAKVYRQMNHA